MRLLVALKIILVLNPVRSATCPLIHSPHLFPESLLNECQNKRKHDVVRKRPKYVESESDENDSEAQNQESSEDECE